MIVVPEEVSEASPLALCPEYRNARYISNDGWIDCELNHPVYGWIPYTLDPNDEDMTIDNNALLAVMAANNDVAAYVPPTQEELDNMAADVVRNERYYRLTTEVDPLVTNPLRWADLTAEKQAEWTQYRRDLLDITEQAGFPHDVTWPTKPE